MECYVSVNEYNECYIHFINNINDKDTNFEMPYDIAENLCFFLSHFGHVELEDENYHNIILEKGKIIKEEDNN